MAEVPTVEQAARALVDEIVEGNEMFWPRLKGLRDDLERALDQPRSSVEQVTRAADTRMDRYIERIAVLNDQWERSEAAREKLAVLSASRIERLYRTLRLAIVLIDYGALTAATILLAGALPEEDG